MLLYLPVFCFCTFCHTSTSSTTFFSFLYMNISAFSRKTFLGASLHFLLLIMASLPQCTQHKVQSLFPETWFHSAAFMIPHFSGGISQRARIMYNKISTLNTSNQQRIVVFSMVRVLEFGNCVAIILKGYTHL